MHGWPGSVFEFLDFIPRLTDPASFGGDPKDAFTVVAPSLPGYGLSFRPGQRRFGVEEIAGLLRRSDDRHARLQAFRGPGRRLGRRHRLAHGLRACGQADRRPRQLPCCPPRAGADQDPTPEQKVTLDELSHWLEEDAGYASIQGTQPQTLALGSPILRLGSPRGSWRSSAPGPIAAAMSRASFTPRPNAREHQLLLVHRRDRFVVLHLLFPGAPTVDDSVAPRSPRRPPTPHSHARSCIRRARSPNRCSPTFAAGPL